jgi:hypothetical protein
MLNLDPRIDLTAPIYEQAERLRVLDAAEDSSATMIEVLKTHLTTDDDPTLWKLTLQNVLLDVDRLGISEKHKAKQFLKVGSCSHWFRPHQSRWTAAGGFAWPSGWHGVAGFSNQGLPELDWSVLFEREAGSWRLASKYSGKARSEIRVSVPARTARHAQAAIHTLWSPPNHRVFYGFRKKEDVWKLAARSDFYSEEESTSANE